MAVKTTNDIGSIVISDDVIASIAGASTVECYGVVGMASVKASDGLSELLKRENLSKGVKVSTQGERVYIDIHIIVEYGVSMMAVANNIKDAVKYNVETLTGLHTGEINIHIRGVRV